MKSRYLAILLPIVFLFGVTLFFFTYLKTMDFHELIILSTEEDTSALPAKFYEGVLYNVRGSKKDIEYLESQNGISFVLRSTYDEVEISQSINCARFLLNKGADVNLVAPVDGFTALHGAVLSNNHQYVKFLLDNGADPTVKDESPRRRDLDKHLTPLELAYDTHDSIDQSLVIELLEKAVEKNK